MPKLTLKRAFVNDGALNRSLRTCLIRRILQDRRLLMSSSEGDLTQTVSVWIKGSNANS